MDLNLIDIYDRHGVEVDMSDLGLMGMKLSIPSPSYRTISEEVEGRSGLIIIDRTLNSRNLTGHFLTKAKTYEESLELKDALYARLGTGTYFYVVEKKNSLKRWKVYLEEWTPERLDRQYHKFEIPLFAQEGTSESINVIKKVFTTNGFRFKNEGNVIIDPRKHSETEIKFKGQSSSLKIINRTTNEEWNWTGDTTGEDTILLKGVRALKNEVSIYGQSNRKILTIELGWNEFEVIGTTGDFELSIQTRFYFL